CVTRRISPPSRDRRAAMIRLVIASLVLAALARPSRSQPAAPGVHLTLGDATVYELVDRRLHKRATPVRDVVLHADGKVEFINDKTDKPMMTFVVKPDGTVFADGKPMAVISLHGLMDLTTNQPLSVTIDGDTVLFKIDDKTVKVTLDPASGNVTV